MHSSFGSDGGRGQDVGREGVAEEELFGGVFAVEEGEGGKGYGEETGLGKEEESMLVCCGEGRKFG